MVKYKYFVSYGNFDMNGFGFGNSFIVWDKKIDSKEDIDTIQSLIEDNLIQSGKATPSRQVTIINYILMRIAEDG